MPRCFQKQPMNKNSADQFERELGLHQNLPLVSVALVGLVFVLLGGWLLVQSGEPIPQQEQEERLDK
jgi:hypothetical protein